MSTVSTKKICRACLLEEGSFESLFALDEDSGVNINFAEMIMSNSSIKIFLGDGLPDQICWECSRKLLELYKFKLKCEQSDSILRSQFTCLNTNILEDNKSGVIENVFIDSSFSSETERLGLFDSALSTENLVCGVCRQSFKSRDILLEHERLHKMVGEEIKISVPKINTKMIKKEPHECEFCQKKFMKLSHFKRHVLTHENKPYVCNECGKSYRLENSLLQHLNIHMGMKPHVCTVCNKSFNQKSSLRNHLRTHNGEKPFLCSTCGRGFNHLGNLRQHTLRHTGVKQYLCGMCGIGFVTKGGLTRHIKTHSGDHPFVCDICNSGFTTSSSLTKHKRIHTGEKPYKCELCEMKFSRSGILARHRKTHTGEKPHQCQFCDRKFAERSDLRSHLMIHTGERPYVCDVCGNAFRQKSTLKYHMKTHNNKEAVSAGDDEEAELYLTNLKVESTLIEEEVSC